MTMYKKKYFSIMAGYILLIVDFHAYASMMTPSTKYPTAGIRLLHQYKTQQFSSHLQCLIECSLDSRCLAINYQLNTQICELNDNSVYVVNGYNSEKNVENWTIYTKGIPSCNNGWLLHESSCYFFSTDTVTWLDAVTACQNRNSTLVQIESMDEDNFLVLRLKVLHGETGGEFHYWTNGNDIDVQTQWAWDYPGGQAIGNYQNLAMSDPNGGTNEDCIALYGFLDFKWVDIPCTSLLFYICERPPSTCASE